MDEDRRKGEGTEGYVCPCAVSRRTFVTASLAGIGVAVLPPVRAASPIAESDIDVETPDGVCDAAFFHPAEGVHPGVLIWPDSGGLRPAMRELGRRLAGEGYAVLVPNHLYRMARAPVFDASFDINNPADRERYRQVTAPFFAVGAAMRDALAYVAYLDQNKRVDKSRKIGTHGYCLGGAYAVRTAAEVGERVGAVASFHGAFLATTKPDSPHLLAYRIKARRLYFAIASDDDAREPETKDKLSEAFAAANLSAEIEVYPNALHGFCVPDSKPPANKVDVERAWSKLVALYNDAL